MVPNGEVRIPLHAVLDLMEAARWAVVYLRDHSGQYETWANKVEQALRQVETAARQAAAAAAGPTVRGEPQGGGGGHPHV